MQIPYVIDNINNQLTDVFNYLLQTLGKPDVDVTTAYLILL